MWEIRACSMIFGVALPTFLVSNSIGYVVVGLGMVIVIGIDTYVSVGITKLFVRPISKVLTEGSGVANESAGYKSMLQSKWWTLVGSTLAVASSTVLYIMMVLQLAWGGPDGELWRNKWLNAFVLGVNVNSILNTIGMIFVCGMLKRVLSAQSAVSSGPGPAAVARHTEFQADSQASSNYSPDELKLSVAHAEEGVFPAILESTTQLSAAPLTVALPEQQGVVGASSYPNASKERHSACLTASSAVQSAAVDYE